MSLPTASSHILVVEDDRDLCLGLAAMLGDEGHLVSTAVKGEQARELLEQRGFQLVITDLRLPGMDGMELVDYVQQHMPKTPVILMTGFSTVDIAVRAMRRGAFDFIEKPLNMDKLRFAVKRALDRAALNHANDYLRHEQPYIYRLQEVQAESPAMRAVMEQVVKIADSEATVLITGETGTGKSLIAGAIHFNSPRRSGTLVNVNCAALAETLLESELFGHVKGSFTGAHKDRVGRFQQAHGGTLFLDEVGDMSPALQAKLLRAIEEKEIQPVGSSRSIHVDVRIISATNQDLEKGVEEGKFRQDLYYRLNVATIWLPPLSQREEDITPLANKFLVDLSLGSNRRRLAFSQPAQEAMLTYAWPGNIREMRNAVERALLFAEGPEIKAEDLNLTRGPSSGPAAPPPMLATLNLEDLERMAIETALRRCDWVQRQAAKLLGITPRGLNYKLKKLGLDSPHLAARRRA